MSFSLFVTRQHRVLQRGFLVLPLAFLLLTCSLLSFRAAAQSSDTSARPRIIITADPELDDNNSLIRLLLYSNELDIEGLVYASSQFHWKGDGKGTRWYVPGREYARFGLNLCPCESWRWADNERFIHDIVDAYAKVYPNLKIHDPNYPDPAKLLATVRYGNIEFDGDFSKDSPGSDLIKERILDDEPGQLFITAWGGHSTIARALKSIQDQFGYTTQWEALRKKIARKVVLLPSGDQDDTYANYIQPNWPDIEYRQFKSGPNYGYGAQLGAKPADSAYLTSSWMKAHVTDRGPLGALYRVWGDGKQMVKDDIMDYFGIAGQTTEQLKKKGYVVWMPVQPKGSWLGEGDNHTFMNMLGNGLRAFEVASYGGWGGRAMAPGEKTAFSFGVVPADTSATAMATTLGNQNRQEPRSDNVAAYPNFFPDAQRDFAARLKWSVTPAFARANHAPVIQIEGPLQVLATAGQKLKLSAAVSDPDGDKVSVTWWPFAVGSYPNPVVPDKQEGTQAELTIPSDAKGGQTIHLVVQATDNGTPALTAYQRVVIRIRG